MTELSMVNALEKLMVGNVNKMAVVAGGVRLMTELERQEIIFWMGESLG